MDASSLLELVDFLNDPKAEVRAVAVDALLPYCSVPDARKVLLTKTGPLVKKLTVLLGDVTAVAHNAIRALINLSAEDDRPDEEQHGRVGASWARAMVQADMVNKVLDILLDPDAVLAELAAMLLSNITRTEGAVIDLFDEFNADGMLEIRIVKLVRAFNKRHFHNPKASMDFVAPVFSNITQTPDGRRLFFRKDGLLLTQLLPFLEDESVIRRGGVIGTLRNLVYETDMHPLLLDPAGPIDLLPKLLKPLMDNTVLPADDYVGMPLELRAMPFTHERESDPEIRKLIVDTLFYLALDSTSRQALHDARVYIVIRNAHQDETDDLTSDAMFKLIDVLLPDMLDGEEAPAAAPSLGIESEIASAPSTATYVVGGGSDASDSDEDIMAGIKPVGDLDALVDGLGSGDDDDDDSAAAAAASAVEVPTPNPDLAALVGDDNDDVE